jgi:hypothetical protein
MVMSCTLCANRCCWRLKLDVRSFELEDRTEVRALDANVRCIVKGGSIL